MSPNLISVTFDRQTAPLSWPGVLRFRRAQRTPIWRAWDCTWLVSLRQIPLPQDALSRSSTCGIGRIASDYLRKDHIPSASTPSACVFAHRAILYYNLM